MDKKELIAEVKSAMAKKNINNVDIKDCVVMGALNVSNVCLMGNDIHFIVEWPIWTNASISGLSDTDAKKVLEKALQAV